MKIALLAAVGITVLPEEPVNKEEAELLRVYFEKHHNLDTLHIAFNTREAAQRVLDTTRENISGFIEGDPRNIVVD